MRTVLTKISLKLTTMPEPIPAERVYRHDASLVSCSVMAIVKVKRFAPGGLVWRYCLLLDASLFTSLGRLNRDGTAA